MKPILVEEIRQTGRTVKRFHPQIINRSIASQKTIEKATELLVGVVENGTAKSIKSNLYSIAGKTGTAQVANTKGGYRDPLGRTSYRSSFVGFFPANDPQYSCIVVIHNPRGVGYTGGAVAAPAFKEIADKVFATHIEVEKPETAEILLASIPTIRQGSADDIKEIYKRFGKKIVNTSSGEWATTSLKSDTVKLSTKELIENLVPDVTGMGLRDAIYLLENSGLRVSFSGRGIVRRQSLNPGTRITRGAQVSIVLN
jgi:cell division protein FtsI (penicillin-binding protein 3)